MFGIIPDLACFGKAMGNGFRFRALSEEQRHEDLRGYFLASPLEVKWRLWQQP